MQRQCRGVRVAKHVRSPGNSTETVSLKYCGKSLSSVLLTDPKEVGCLVDNSTKAYIVRVWRQKALIGQAAIYTRNVCLSKPTSRRMIDHREDNGDDWQPSNVSLPVFHAVRTNTPDLLLHFTLDVLAITRVECWQQHGSAVTLPKERR